MQEDLHRLLQKAFEARLTAEAACQTHTKRIMDRYTEGPSDAFRGTLVWTRDIMAGGSPGVESRNSLVQNASLRLTLARGVCTSGALTLAKPPSSVQA